MTAKDKYLATLQCLANASGELSALAGDAAQSIADQQAANESEELEAGYCHGLRASRLSMQVGALDVWIKLAAADLPRLKLEADLAFHEEAVATFGAEQGHRIEPSNN